MSTKRFLAHLSVVFVAVLAPRQAAAVRFEDFGPQLGLGEADLVTIVLNLISAALGIIGILAVVMILLGGFRWLLSGGDEEKIAQAKRTIGATIVGLVIILLSWAIVNFVINTTANVSGAP